MPRHLGEEGTEQFIVGTWVNDEPIRNLSVHDPFHTTTVHLRGWRHALRCMFGGLRVRVSVRGSDGAVSAIMQLDPVMLQKLTDACGRSARESD